ncbi:hypothetical protein [Streptomyces sp. NPDC101149]|uniref:hypothetical protein n=1 Tax=Streptomyces sp. NPDC101149 TaxID=3366113 RepID=UPI003803F52A
MAGQDVVPGPSEDVEGVGHSDITLLVVEEGLDIQVVFVFPEFGWYHLPDE